MPLQNIWISIFRSFNYVCNVTVILFSCASQTWSWDLIKAATRFSVFFERQWCSLQLFVHRGCSTQQTPRSFSFYHRSLEVFKEYSWLYLICLQQMERPKPEISFIQPTEYCLCGHSGRFTHCPHKILKKCHSSGITELCCISPLLFQLFL